MFWIGVGATLLTMCVLLVVAAVVMMIRKGK